ncbi:MAG: phosphatase PAP2 family protein [Verrucomicrobiota bacterium]
MRLFQQPVVRIFWKDICELVKEAWAVGKKRARWFLGAGLVVGVATVWVFPHDAEWVRALSPGKDSPMWAKQFSFWGDFYTGTLILGAILWFIGFFRKKDLWKKTAIACVLAAAFAGILVNCFRLTLGRPRPSSEIADGFYGLQKSYAYHSFPSGHAATAFGTATTIAVALPPLGVPAVVAATGVVAARVSLKRHYVSDILVGGFVGICFGVAFGCAAKKTKSE